MPETPLRTEEDRREYFRERMARVFARMSAAGFPIAVVPGTGGRRTAEQQARLYAKGRTTPGMIVTGLDGVEKIGHHQAETGIDVHFPQSAANFKLLGKIVREEGLTWGGDWRELDGKPFSDPAHVQLGANLPGTEIGDHPVPIGSRATGYTDPASVQVYPTRRPSAAPVLSARQEPPQGPISAVGPGRHPDMVLRAGPEPYTVYTGHAIHPNTNLPVDQQSEPILAVGQGQRADVNLRNPPTPFVGPAEQPRPGAHADVNLQRPQPILAGGPGQRADVNLHAPTVPTQAHSGQHTDVNLQNPFVGPAEQPRPGAHADVNLQRPQPILAVGPGMHADVTLPLERVGTARSIGVNLDGQEVLLPTVSHDDRIMTTQEAIDAYRTTGEDLGKGDTVAASPLVTQGTHANHADVVLGRPAPALSWDQIASAPPTDPWDAIPASPWDQIPRK